jgi:hypothetical protein
LAINSISVNTATGSSLKRKGKEVETAKEVFRRQARAEEKLPHIRGQKNTTPRSNRRGDGPAEDIDINASGDKQDELGTQYTLNHNKYRTPEVDNIPIRLLKKATVLLPRTQKGTRMLINALKTPDPAAIL